MRINTRQVYGWCLMPLLFFNIYICKTLFITYCDDHFCFLNKILLFLYFRVCSNIINFVRDCYPTKHVKLHCRFCITDGQVNLDG